MTSPGRKYLFDILRAIELAEDFVRDIPDFAAYRADVKTRSAVERQLGIVGEAVNQLRRVWPHAELPNTKQMVDFRNRLIHSYDNIDDVIVWAILHRHLPALKADVQRHLAEGE
ncbi:Uncharacterized conserved protein, contains HEPN domain [Hymenobacter daecheongensis DSM 21074]|uniref:Uncharacterized conserved protein, contains HEPN domain n=1 Tax=Hymenobacter daecheongensis DSM 21074 TaxID=1121955 RepID=A0A1M6EJH4_9BACT|nr:HepT-like ribonuclease domain-containing protein [Hymenobacter daecheongensis]SHI85601.1 Uncharacterized conserved protein, contains HEPN domain [Hymenobacter daecheongensis DSM 21074]